MPPFPQVFHKCSFGRQLKASGGPEDADNGGDVVLGGVDFGVEVAHFVGGDFAGQIRERVAEFGEFGQGVAAHDGDRVVGREIVAIVGESAGGACIGEAVAGGAG